MPIKWLILLGLGTACGLAQTVCAPVAAFSPCQIVFELDASEMREHTNPYWSVEIRAEIRSPRYKTYQAYGFHDGGNRLVIRFAPTEPGTWAFRVTANLPRFNGKEGTFSATESAHPGYVIVRNQRHWAYSESLKPHLFMGDTIYPFASIERSVLDKLIEQRAAQKFNHIRGFVLGSDPVKAFPAPDRPNLTFFQDVDKRVAAMNEKGITADLIIGQYAGHLTRQFPDRQQRERLMRFLAARYSAYGITWQLTEAFEDYENARDLCKELGEYFKRFDPQAHPRTTAALTSSSALAGDGWLNYILYSSADDNLNAVERQLYLKPFVNAGFALEEASNDQEVRHRLWRSAMNGQYPVFANSGTGGTAKSQIDESRAASSGAKYMTNWFDFFSRTRWWDLEPYFDVDGGQAMALEGVEYIVYVEKPSGPIEVLVEKHGYDVYWFNPSTGEYLRPKDKDWRGEKFVAEAPDAKSDWVLHLSRDGRKEGMLKSYKFEARPVPMQEVEITEKAVPFELAEPKGDTISISKPPAFALQLKRQTRATRAMNYLLTGEVTTSGQGQRVLATGPSGQLKIPQAFGAQLPAVMLLRVTALNANGKAYALDRVFKLVP